MLVKRGELHSHCVNQGVLFEFGDSAYFSTFVMDATNWELINAQDVKGFIDKNGLSGIETFLKQKLKRWKDVEINIGITGDSGTGKSSFINAIRELPDDDEMAAKVGVTETTTEPCRFAHPTNSKICFWDLPGIGTPNLPDLNTYCKKVQLEKYDTFLIFTASRFTENDLKLAKQIKRVKKKFFLIRTKIDENVRAERRKRSFNEEAMLNKIRQDCAKNLDNVASDLKEIFLISNHYPNKWDFVRLKEAILDVLPTRQRESLTLSLGNLTSLSREIVQRKAQVLKGRIFMVASASAVAALVPLPGLSVFVDLQLITGEIDFYRSQLGLPEEGSCDFARLNADNQEKVRKFCFTTAVQVAGFMAAYASKTAIGKFLRFIPLIGQAIASGMSFRMTYDSLQRCLKELEETALLVLEDIAARSVDHFDTD